MERQTVDDVEVIAEAYRLIRSDRFNHGTPLLTDLYAMFPEVDKMRVNLCAKKAVIKYNDQQRRPVRL